MRLLKWLLKNITFIIFIVFLLWKLWNFYWFFDLLSHFLLQYLVVTFLATILLWFLKEKSAILWLILATILALHIFPAYLPNSEKKIQNIDYYFMNTLVVNKKTAPIINDISEKKPKIIALVEANEKIVDEIKNRWNYKYSFYEKQWTFSIAIFSIYKIEKAKIIKIKWIPFFRWEINWKKTYIIHPIPPISKEKYEAQKEYFKTISNDLKAVKDKDFILLWDFNSTPFSKVFQKYFWDYKYNKIYSWSTDTVLSIPIDNIVSNFKIDVYPWKKLTSDHKPLYAKEATIQ